MGMAVPDITGAALTPYGDARFLTPRPVAAPPATADVAIVGSAFGPDHLPDQMVIIGPEHTTYTDLYAGLDPAGMPARVLYGGTYHPPVTGALKLGG